MRAVEQSATEIIIVSLYDQITASKIAAFKKHVHAWSLKFYC
jgi:hypothetical protein